MRLPICICQSSILHSFVYCDIHCAELLQIKYAFIIQTVWLTAYWKIHKCFNFSTCRYYIKTLILVLVCISVSYHYLMLVKI